MAAYQDFLHTLPTYFREFAVEQNYQLYTAQDHAVWRYIMRQNCHFLKNHAHPSYLEGLEKTGISIEKIPHIEEMNECLAKIGWAAIIVEGFIPPAVFMDFQAHRILPISSDIRDLNHLLYTPAPDIVHESAGHAPILINEEYAHFVKKIGEYGALAISTKKDREVYEAIRYLSIIKEYPYAEEKEIKSAEEDLKTKTKNNTYISEAAQIARFHWWTVEYGLIGTPDNYTQIGAGLLSSVGESQSCLSSEIKKIPLSLKAVDYSYDITNKQPQLFVAKNFAHLSQVLEEFADTMCFRVGGVTSIKKAVESEQVSTLQFSSGMQVSGVVSSYLTDNHGEVSYIRTQGPTSLAFHHEELPGHSIHYHRHGFGAPVGKLAKQKTPLEKLTWDELNRLGIVANQDVTLLFDSGIKVQGYLKSIFRREHCNLMMSFENCLVTGPDGSILFDPHWGVYDMVIGEKIPSVFAGSADKTTFNTYQERSPHRPIRVEYNEKDRSIHQLYQQIRDIREKSINGSLEIFRELYQQILDKAPQHWLLHLEMLELLYIHENKAQVAPLKEHISYEINQLRNHSKEFQTLIDNGLTILTKKFKFDK